MSYSSDDADQDFIAAALPAFIDVTLNNVQVKYGATLDLGTTVLIQ